jgi:chlorite dismutase
MYMDFINPEHEEDRTHIIPGKAKYLFIYPFVKTREWYLLTQFTRQGIMDEHIYVGNKYPSVKLNTTYCFGIDDYEFVVAFETDSPDDFLDLVQELRETEGSRYVKEDTPIFSCVAMSIEDVVKSLGC